MEIFLKGTAGKLQAKLWLPALADRSAAHPVRPPPAAAVVCHPHPVHGGTMDNNVVFRAARGLQAAGLAVLRFNFRGAGTSEGEHDGGGAEELDLLAALDWMQERFRGVPLWVAGFSFGARTAASLARRERRIARLICLALPCKAFDCRFVVDVLPPTLLLMSRRDEFGTLADLAERVGPMPAHIQTEELDGMDHFFRGQTPELEARVRDYALEHLTQ